MRRLLPILLMAAIAGCGGESDDPVSTLSGDLAVDAVTTAYPFAQAAADQFQTDHPDVTIVVTRSRSEDALGRFCEGRADIIALTRPIADERAPGCRPSRGVSSALEIAAGQRVYLYAGQDPRTRAAGALRDFMAAHHERIAEAAAVADER